MANNEYLNKNFLDSYGTNWLFDILTPNSGSLVFKSIPSELTQIINKIKIIPAWNNGEAILSSVFTASHDTNTSNDYTITVYSNADCEKNFKEFTIEYGNINGYGTTYEYSTEKTETKAIYKKYINLLSDDDPIEYSDFFALKFNNLNPQDSLYSEYFTIKLTNPATQSNYISLINYDYFVSQSTYELSNNPVFRIASGSLESGIYYENNEAVFFGKGYENHSIVILNVDPINNSIELNVQRNENSNEKNAEKMYSAISSSVDNMNAGVYPYWSLINTKTEIPVLILPIRILARDFNYSTNPTFYSENGEIRTVDFKSNPVSYFTTIGLYNDKYELLGIAKFSRPFKKEFTEQYAFEVNIEIL